MLTRYVCNTWLFQDITNDNKSMFVKMETNNKSLLDTLPRELRDEIYRYLLRTSRTFVGNAPTQYYEMDLAILRTNKKFSAEARMVMDENDFVVIRFDQNAQPTGPTFDWWYNAIPRIQGLSARTVIRRALTISLGGLDSTREDYDKARLVIVTGPETIDMLEIGFWQWLLYLGHPMHPMRGEVVLGLHLGPKRGKLAKALSQSLLQLNTTKTISITSTANKMHAQFAVDHIRESSPSPESAMEFVSNHIKQAEEAYSQGFYHLASHKWSRMIIYCHLMDCAGFTEVELLTLGDRLSPSSSAALTAHLGIVKAHLRGKRYSIAVTKCRELLLWENKLSTLLKAQSLLCAWIAYVASFKTCRLALPLFQDMQVGPVIAIDYFDHGLHLFEKALMALKITADSDRQISYREWERYWALLELKEGLNKDEDELEV